MKISKYQLLLASIIILIGSKISIYGQPVTDTKLEFSNAPALFKENGKLCQKIIGSYQADNAVTLQITYKGKRC